MGLYFSNLHIKTKNFNSVEKEIINYYTGLGIKPVDCDKSDLVVSIYVSQNKDWISVYNDDFTYEDILKISPLISKNIGVDTLAISSFDSDYMFLNLLNINDSVDLWLNIGKSREVKLGRRNNINEWKPKINNFDLFKQNTKKEYICTEDFLEHSLEYFDLDYEQIISFDSNCNCHKLYFKLPIDNKIPNTTLKFSCYDLSPIKSGNIVFCKVNNEGRSSKGLAIVFSGDYIEKDEIVFENVELVLNKEDLTSIYIPITLEKVKLPDGKYIYIWKDPNYKIMLYVPRDLPARIWDRKRSLSSIGLRFVPKGNNRKMLDIMITFIPLVNPIEGQCTWFVWRNHKSKKDYVEYYNKEQIRLQKQCGAKIELIDKEEYDLD